MNRPLRDLLGPKPFAPTKPDARVPVATYRFEPLDRIRFDGTEWVYLRATEGGHVLRQRNGSLEEAFTHREMHAIAHSRGFGHDRGFYAEGNGRAREWAGVARLSDLPPRERLNVSWEHGFCVRFMSMEARGETSRSDAKMKSAAKRIYADMLTAGAFVPTVRRKGRGKLPDEVSLRRAPSPRTLRKWLCDLERNGMEAIVLRDGRHRSGNRKDRLTDEAYAAIADAVRDYMTEKRPKVTNCHAGMCTALSTLNAERAAEGLKAIPEPSIKALTKSIKAMPAFEVYASRHGLDAAKKYFRIVIGAPDASLPGERVEMDEGTFNIQSIMKKRGTWAKLPPDVRRALSGRWTLCGAIDVRTKIILGLRMEPTATTSLAKGTLRMVTMDKTPIARKAGAVTPWDMALNPDLVVTDGGSALTSNEFVAAVADLRAKHDVPTNGMPHLRGTIERVIGTLDATIMPFLSGRTFADVEEKGEYDPVARASLTTAELADVMVIAVVDGYHNRPHAGLMGETPLNAWRRLTEEHAACAPPGADDRRAIFGTELVRTVNNRGVRFLGLYYSDAVVGAHLLDRDRFDVVIRVDEDDLGWISVLLDGAWHAVPCLDDAFEGVSAHQWLGAMTDLRRRFAREAEMSRGVVLDAVAAIKRIAGEAERSAGIHVAPIPADRIDAAERELLRGFSVPPQDADRHDGDPLDDVIPVGDPDDEGGPGPDDGTQDEPFTVEEG